MRKGNAKRVLQLRFLSGGCFSVLLLLLLCSRILCWAEQERWLRRRQAGNLLLAMQLAVLSSC